jgi:hypothetical protein
VASTDSVKHLRRFLNALLGVVMTPIILFEEWGWEPLRKLAAAAANSWPLAWLNRRIAKLPPYAALAVMAVPSMTIIPVKVVAVWLISRGYVGWSVALLVVSKLLGTAFLAHLFSLTQPALMRLVWFASAYTRWVAWKTELMARVKATAVWRAAQRLSQRLKAAWRHR